MIREYSVRHAAARRSTRAMLIAGSGLFALTGGMTPACAAEAVADVAAGEEGADDIVVSGSRPIAESQAAALKIQQESPSLVSVVASDGVGRLPDQNIAQAVSRLPGVAVQRDQGQARYVNLRGSPINWTTLSFDGINVVSPEGRDARFDSIPSAIASQIIVRKAVTPNMTGETIAGNVDIITRSAFDYKGFHLAGKAGAGYVELGRRGEYEGQLVVSDRWDTGIGEIGILASGSYYRRDMVTDNFETDWEAVPQDQRPGFETRDWARETENKLYRLTRRNYSASGRIDWKPDPSHRFFASSIYSAFTDDEQRNNYIFDLDDRQSSLAPSRAACPATAAPRTTTGYADVCAGNTPYRGTVYGVDINANFTVRDYLQSVFTNTIGGDHDLDGGWTVKWRGNYTKSVDDRTQPAQLNYDSPSAPGTRPTVGYDLTDRQLSRVELYRTTFANGTYGRGDRVTNIEDFPLGLVRLRSLKAKDITSAYTGKLDITKRTELLGGDTRFTFGAQYDRRTKQSNERLLELNSAARFAAAGIPPGYDAISQPGKFRGEIPLGYAFQYFDKGKILDLVRQAQTAGGTYAPVTGNFYNVREEVWSGYGMVESRHDWGSVVAGARVEHIKNDSSAIVALCGADTAIDVEKSRTLVYPSAHLNFDLDDTKKVRLSFNTGAARPDYDQLRPNFTFNDGNLTVSGGNPEARPEKARGVDLYFEWYMQPQGYFSVGVYYKDVKDVLFNVTRTFGLDVLNGGGTDRSQYILSTIGNGGDGHIYGAEVAFSQQLDPYTGALGLPDWVGGFGIQANATFNKSRAETPDGRRIRFPGTSDVVYNLSGYYEKYGFSARVSYQKRTNWIDAIGAFDTINGVFRGVDSGDQYWAADDELDASIRYAINPNVEIYADFANLLNGAGRRYAGTSARTIEHETFGRRYTGGVRVNF